MNILNISLVYEILFNMKIKGESEIFKLALKDLIFFKNKVLQQFGAPVSGEYIKGS